MRSGRRRSRRTAGWILAGLGLGWASVAAAEGHVVSGVVHRDLFCDQDSAITVLLNDDRPTLVDASGAFRFDDVADGDYTVRALPECRPSEYTTDIVFVRGGDAYTELGAISCPKEVVVTRISDDAVRIVGRCYYIHSGASANLYIDNQLVGEVSGDTPGNYQTTLDVSGYAPGRYILLIAVPGPVLGIEVGYGFLDIDQRECAGDCNRDGRVAVGELVTAVGEALRGRAETCGAADTNASGTIDVGELVAATGDLLDGCP